jgi:dTDP-glucose pyrophosphorylase
MAGLGSRFRKAGYTVPKYKIEVNGKNLFQWSMTSLTDFNKQENVKYIFIVRKEDNAREFIINEAKKFGIQDINVIEIDKLTDGQATTALLAKEVWNENEEMIVYNIDTYVEADTMKYSDIKGDGFIPCFNAEGDHWSFVKLDENENAIEVKEKQRISNNCTLGLYYFRSCKLYENLYNEYYKDDEHIEKNEKYIAPLYNYMISQKMQVNISIVPAEKVHVLGTPEEVEIFKKI